MSNRIAGNLPCHVCGSSDAVSLYKNEMNVVDGACFSCGSYIDPIACAERYPDGVQAEGKPKMTQEELADALARIKAKPDAGIRDRLIFKKTCAFYGVKVDVDDGTPVKHYYPIHDSKGELAAYKVKNTLVKAAKNEVKAIKEAGDTPDPELVALAKSAAPFYTLGAANRSTPLFGQHLFAKNQKMLIITEGELDALAVHQTLSDSDKGFNTACVSITIGAEAAVEQIRANYDYVSSFSKVYVCFDNDTAGNKAANEVLRLLKPQQGYHMKLRRKDACDYLSNDDAAGLREAYFKAEPFSRVDVVEAGNTLSLLIERASTTKISFPPFMDTFNDMFRGGIALGEVTVIAAPTSAGKTTMVNELIHHWVMTSEYKVGIVSLEADVAESVENLMSISANRRLSNMSDDEKVAYYRSDEAARLHKYTTRREDGSDRFAVLNHQGAVGDGDLIDKTELLVKQHGCKIVVIDPLQLGMSGKSLDEVDVFMSDILKLTKQCGIATVLVAHVRKSTSGEKALSEGGRISEESIKGSGSIIQVAFNTILLYRDKLAECATERNTIHALVSKNRRCGNTGSAGSYVYNNISGRLQKAEASTVAPLVRDTELFALLDDESKKDEKVTALLAAPLFKRVSNEANNEVDVE